MRMLRVGLLITVLSLWIASARAQRLQLTQKVELNSRRDDFAAVGKYRQYWVGYRGQPSMAEILLFDSAGVLQKTVPITGYDNDCSSIRFQCNATHLCVYYEKREGKTQILQGVKLLNDTVFSEPKVIASYDKSGYGSRYDIQFAVSENSAYVLFYNLRSGGEEFALQSQILNDQLDLISEVNQLFEKDKIRFLYKEAISNTGYAYIAASTDLDVKSAADQIQVLSLVPGAGSWSIIEMPVNGKYISDVTLLIDNANSNTLHLAGYYADAGRGVPKGFFLTQVTPGSQQELIGLAVPINASFSKSHADLRDLKIKGMSVSKNGATEIITEKTFQSTHMVSSPSSMMGVGTLGVMNPSIDNGRVVTDYNYDEISVFNISKEGKLNWNQHVLKSQLSTDDNGIYSSFALLESRLGKVYIFNDLNRRSTKLIAGYLSAKGIISLKQLPTTEAMNNVNILPRSAVQTGRNEIFMPCISKGYLCFLNIQF